MVLPERTDHGHQDTHIGPQFLAVLTALAGKPAGGPLMEQAAPSRVKMVRTEHSIQGAARVVHCTIA